MTSNYSISLHRSYTTSWGATQFGIELDHVDHNGKRYYIVEPGIQFGVRVNMPGNWSQVECVVAIDGRDVLKNEPANYEIHRGYLVRENKCDVKGWRISDNEIKVFMSAALGQGKTTNEKSGGSVASRGTIAAAVFAEYQEPRTYRSRGGFEAMSLGSPMRGASLDMDTDVTLESCVGPAMLGGGHTFGFTGQQTNSGGSRGLRAAQPKAAMAAPSVGTAAGATVSDVVTKRGFQRAGAPTLIEIEYDSRASLIARGILRETSKAWSGMTAAPGAGNYCDPNKL